MRPAAVIAVGALEAAALVAVVAVGAGYAAGVRALWARGRGRGVSVARVAGFGVGLAAAAAAVAPPVASWAERALSGHMVQHVLLVTAAAPLLVLGRPGVVVGAAAPLAIRRGVRRLGHRLRPLTRVVGGPVVAWTVAAAVLLGWHVRTLYEAALSHDAVHVAEHATLVASSALFWWVAFRPVRPLPDGADVVYVFAGGFPGAALGALLVFATSPVYPLYAARAAGFDPLRDQQLAGAIMWVPAAFFSVVVAGALFVRWLRRVERAQRESERRSGLHVAAPEAGS